MNVILRLSRPSSSEPTQRKNEKNLLFWNPTDVTVLIQWRLGVWKVSDEVTCEVAFQLVAPLYGFWMIRSPEQSQERFKNNVLFLLASISEQFTSLVLSPTLISHRSFPGPKLKEQPDFINGNNSLTSLIKALMSSPQVLGSSEKYWVGAHGLGFKFLQHL